MSTEIQKFDPLVANVKAFVAPAKTMAVTDNVSANFAIETGKTIKEYQKKIEDLRKALVGPYNTKVKEINDYAKLIAKPLDEVETHLKKQLSAFADAQRKIREEEQRKLDAQREAAKKKMEEEIAAATSGVDDSLEKLALAARTASEHKPILAEIKSQEKEIEATAIKGVRVTWKSEITNEALVPREYLIVDQKKINAAIAAGARDIPGVRIFEETSIAFGKTTAVPTAALVNEYFGG
jgi:hypothetical protein